MTDTAPTALTFPTNLCSTHQSPSAACRICNPAILDLEDEIAALREAVRVLAEDLAEYTMPVGVDGTIVNCCSDAVNANPIAFDALKEAGK